MARITLSDYQTGRFPVPDLDMKAVGAGVAVKFVLGAAVLLTTADFAHMFWAGTVVGAVTTLLLPLSQMSVSSRLIDGPVEGGIASAIGFTLVFPIYGLLMWTGFSAARDTGDAIFTTGAMLPIQYVMAVLSSGTGGLIGGVAAVLVYQLYRKLRY